MRPNGLIYDGEFLQNQMTGKAKITFPNKEQYQGEMNGGKRHG
jgi:hypothetical protein